MLEEVFTTTNKIIPDTDFLTQNTADLKAMLETIPEEALNYEEDIFEKDFKVVLNSFEGQEEKSDNMTSFNCDQCKFRGTSERCLYAHIIFVHDPKLYTCNTCPMKTRTQQAMYYHIDMKHNVYWEIEEEARNSLYAQRDRQGHPQGKKEESAVENSENEDIMVKVKTEVEDTIVPFKYDCEFCEKSFLTDRSLVVHASKMHKEDWRNKDKISHNIDFNLERKDSLTRSPPAKKVKDKSTEIINDLPNSIIKEKDEEITNLRAQVKKLQSQLQEVKDVKIQFLTKIPTRKSSEQVEANANIINLVEVDEISSRSFKCENCGIGVGQKGKLLGHRCQKEAIKEPYKWQFHVDKQQPSQDEIYEIHSCNKCKQVFKTKPDLEEHVDVVHMDTDIKDSLKSDGPSSSGLHDMKFICENCEKEFSNRCELFKHMNEHITEKADIVTQEHQRPDEESNSTSGAWERAGSRFECPICGYTRNTKSQIEKHMHTHDEEEEEHSCQECSYQTNNIDQLHEHVARAHKQINSAQFKCNLCQLEFRNQKETNMHNRNIHRKSFKPCRNFPTNYCEYDSECNFFHIVLNQGEHVCYKCGDVLSNKTLLMKHITKDHGEEICKKFLDNKCQFGEKCLFRHTNSPAQNVVNRSQGNQSPPVFHNPPTSGQPNLAVGEQEKKYQMMNQLMSMMVNQLMNLNM